MGIKEEVDRLIKEWNKYCSDLSIQASSNMSKHYLDKNKEIQPVRDLINLGIGALPFIKEYIEKWDPVSSVGEGNFIGLGGYLYVLRQITHDKIPIPVEIQGKMDKLKIHLLNSLDDYL